MHDELAATIRRRFEGAAIARTEHTAGESLHAEVAFGGETFRLQAAMEPIGRVHVELPCTDGFELAVTWTDRSRAGAREASFDDSFLVETNDAALANVWLDQEVRDWLLASRYIAAAPLAERATFLLFRDGTWHYDVRHDEVSAHCIGPEPSAERVADMLTAALSLASRPHRWARAFVPVAKAVGGEVASRVELGGRPIVRVRRGKTDVHLRLLRRLGPADAGRLRTVISAHRHASSGETLSLIADDLPRAAWPPPPELGGSSVRIDSRARALLDAARPSTTIVRAHDVEITFDGAVSNPGRLGPAIELAARWCSDASDEGPYR